MHATWITAILLSIVSAQGMENYILSTFSAQDRENHKQLASQAEEYNNNHWLPDEILSLIFSYRQTQKNNWAIDRFPGGPYNPSFPLPCSKRNLVLKQVILKWDTEVILLENNINFFMKLRATCKKINTLLTFEKIGDFCKDYTIAHKNKLLQFLTRYCEINNKPLYKRILILIYAGADLDDQVWANHLLTHACDNNNTRLAKALLKSQEIDPNNIHQCDPIFFAAKTIEMAQIFIDNDTNVHVTGSDFSTNILWKILCDNDPSELMEFYLQKGVDPKQLSSFNECILHRFAELSCHCKGDHDEFFKKGLILLAVMPKEMINTLDNSGRTPIDVAKARYKSSFMSKDEKKENSETFKKTVQLFREHDGLTAHELKKREQIARKNKAQKDTQNCIIS